MKKLFSIVALMFTMSLATVYLTAAGTEEQPVPLAVKQTKPTGGHNPLPKSPTEIPEVYLSGNVLTFDAALEGCTVQLLDEDETLVFFDSIEENQTSLVLPSYLSGTYELQIIRGSIMFYAFIEL